MSEEERTREQPGSTQPEPPKESPGSIEVGEIEAVRARFEERETSIEHRQEGTRATLSYILAGILGVLLLAAVVAAFVGGESWENVRVLLQAVLPGVTALLGSAMGFYFGEQRGRRR